MTHPKSTSPETSHLANKQLFNQRFLSDSSSESSLHGTDFNAGGYEHYPNDVPLTPAGIPEISSGVPAMDRLHHDLFSALDGLSCCEDHEFGVRYADFVSKAERAFREEEQWMEDIDYPLLGIHLEQHARVLCALHHVHSQVMNGDLALGRKVVEELLPQWLVFHISTMDTPFAIAMQLAQNEREPAFHPS
jgi:hemerythrin